MAGRPSLHIFPDVNSLSRAAGQEIIRLGVAAHQERGRFRLVLNGGGTPQRLFEVLGSPPNSKAPFWPDTHLYWGDERCVRPDESGSNYYQIKRTMLNALSIPAGQIHRIKGEAGPEPAAREYAALLKAHAEPGREWPVFDLVLLGMGADGHTAGLFPGQVLEYDPLPVRGVWAEYEDRPAARVTMTLPVFRSARRIMVLIAGAEKSVTVQTIFNSPGSIELHPIRGVLTGVVDWWMDEKAAGKLAG